MPAIDEYSLATIPIELLFNETPLARATAFIWENSNKYYLITNWHNVSGKDPNTDAHLSATAAEPNIITGHFNTKGGNLGDKHHLGMRIRDDNGKAAWLVHPVHKRQVDVVAIPLAGSLSTTVEFRPINRMSSTNLHIDIGMDVFVLGYPFGTGETGLPVWKRGSVASEPQLVPDVTPHLLVDTASRPGMSGSPVVLRSWGSHVLEDGSTSISTRATKFVGVYSGRLHTKNALEAQIGMVWPAIRIDEIVAGGVKEYG